MPLKHMTETVLVVLLGAAILLTGFVAAVLPPLWVSMVPWIGALILALLYPVLLYPYFRDKRADYPFRALHFVPAIMLLLWLAFQMIASSFPTFAGFLEVYLWGWTLPAVLTAFFLLFTFCLSVIRQRNERILVLVLLLVPFLALAVTAQQRQWNPQLAAHIWPYVGVRTGEIAQNDRNTEHSQNSSEEQLRMQMRRMDRREERLAQMQQGSGGLTSIAIKPVQGPSSATLIAVGASRASRGENSSLPPPKLSSSGPELDALALLFVASYCGTLHYKTRRRMRA